MIRRLPQRLTVTLLIFVVAMLGQGGRAGAQQCVGDCGGNGVVAINDLILAVNIVLGQASLDECPALGVGPVGIAELIASVGNALCECRPCPEPPTPGATETRQPTASASPTPTFTALPSATPTATQLTSRWHEDQLKIPSSTCPGRIVSQLRQNLAGVAADYRVYERGAESEIEDLSSGQRLPASIGNDGVLSFDLASTDSEGACTVTLTLQVRVNLRRSPVTATYSGGFRTMSCPNQVNCSLKVSSRWERQAELFLPTGGPLFIPPQVPIAFPCDWRDGYGSCGRDPVGGSFSGSFGGARSALYVDGQLIAAGASVTP